MRSIKPFLIIICFVIFVVTLLRTKTKKHRMIVNILFLFPLSFTFFITVIVPFIFGVYYSLTDWNGIKYDHFVGLNNYIKIFSSSDYIYSFFLTFIYACINILAVNIFSFSLALLCTSKCKGIHFFRVAFFIPNLIGGIVLGYVWQFIFNKVMTVLLPGMPSMLSSPNTAIAAILIVSSWQYVGYIMMIYITGINTIPQDVLEAAAVDGASTWRALMSIKIPMLASSFTICLFLTLVNSFKQFDLNYSITNGAPSRIIGGLAVPSTEMLALNIYRTAIAKNNYALGQAKAVIFFIILALVSLTQVYISKRKEVEA